MSSSQKATIAKALRKMKTKMESALRELEETKKVCCRTYRGHKRGSKGGSANFALKRAPGWLLWVGRIALLFGCHSPFIFPLVRASYQ